MWWRAEGASHPSSPQNTVVYICHHSAVLSVWRDNLIFAQQPQSRYTKQMKQRSVYISTLSYTQEIWVIQTDEWRRSDRNELTLLVGRVWPQLLFGVMTHYRLLRYTAVLALLRLLQIKSLCWLHRLRFLGLVSSSVLSNVGCGHGKPTTIFLTVDLKSHISISIT